MHAICSLPFILINTEKKIQQAGVAALVAANHWSQAQPAHSYLTSHPKLTSKQTTNSEKLLMHNLHQNSTTSLFSSNL